MPRVIGPMMALPAFGFGRAGAVGAGFQSAAPRVGNPVYVPAPAYFGCKAPIALLLANAPVHKDFPTFGANGGYGPGRKHGEPIGYDAPAGYYSPAGDYSRAGYYSPNKDFCSPVYDPSVKYGPGAVFGMDPARAAATRHVEAAYMSELDFERHVQEALHHGLFTAAATCSGASALRFMV